MTGKLVSIREAIANHVRSGTHVLMGAQLEQMIPFAAGHEIIRQNCRNLTLSGLFFGTAPPVASFVSTDNTTKGNWQGSYGTDGYNVIGAAAVEDYRGF